MSCESVRPKQLEVYHTTYNLLKLVTRELKNFSRDIRQPVGNRLLGEILRLITFIHRAKHASRDLEAIVHSPDSASRLATANSYLGLLRQVSSFRQREALCELSSELGLAAGADFEKVIMS